jgi:eukaryotic-like serine/threonine-protein kinase
VVPNRRSAEATPTTSSGLGVNEDTSSSAVIRAAASQAVAGPMAKQRTAPRVALVVVAALCLLSLAATTAVWSTRRAPKLTEKDTVVLADFQNTSGDVVFDTVLKQALTVELGQSPFLNLMPDKKTNETLRLMGRSAGERLTLDVAQEVCVRTGSKALVAGSISIFGTKFLVSLNAVACGDGAMLASAQAEAGTKEDVLEALSRAASRLRMELGESLPSIRKYDVPMQATTTSFEALQSLSLANRVARIEGDAASIPLVERALEYDPQFAMAYVALARRYNNLDEPQLSLENSRRAYELRDRVTERERLQISAMYLRATGDLDSLNKILEVWKVEYPHDGGPHGRLCANYQFIGQYEKALAECQEALRLAPEDNSNYDNLAADYMNLNRYDESSGTCAEAYAHHLSCAVAYDLDFLRGDMAGMMRELSAATGKPGEEDALLSAHANTLAFHGQLQQARDFSSRATAAALHSGLKESSSLWRVNAALWEAELGETARAQRAVNEAFELAPSRNTKVLGAIALARIGQTAKAGQLVRQLERSDADNTLLNIYWLPVIHAAIELKRGRSSNALAVLKTAAPYELAQPSPNEIGTLYPVYLSGQAYLTAHNGPAAAEEFQKIIDHAGIVGNFVTGALAHLGLARAYALEGQTDKGRAAYQNFFALWENADPDVPVLKQAQAEYAKLH